MEEQRPTEVQLASTKRVPVTYAVQEKLKHRPSWAEAEEDSNEDGGDNAEQ